MIKHNSPTLGKEEQQAAARVIKSQYLAQGEEVRLFENEICSYLGLPPGHAVAVSSGTAALYMALWALKAKNKKVAIPAYSCSSLRHAVSMAQGKEVLVDSNRHNPNICQTSLSKKKAHIAIIPHYYGIPYSPIVQITKKMPVIEDCAQALGASIKGKKVGLFGTLGVFSFYATKLITSGGQGGMVVSKNKKLIESIRDYLQFDCRHDYNKRFNFQMTDLAAAIGRAQLKKLPSFLKKRESLFKAYQKEKLPLVDTQTNALKPVRYRALYYTTSPQSILKKLKQKNITGIIPLEEWELLGPASHFQQAYYWTQHLVSLPLYPSLSLRDIKRIAGALK
ncbi:DegT/DnrJ/EryC1/StrS family aminotransferase [bacterium]|nr:DegT/DnrJ/EryC1/StrS family aminotransferase [bacterium]